MLEKQSASGQRNTRVRTSITRRGLVAGALVAGAFGSRRAKAAEPIPIRMMALGTGLPLLIATAWKEEGFNAKYGFQLEVHETGNLSNQWNALRSGSFDLVMGNFLDVLRQHKAGLKAKAFQFGYNYTDPIVTLSERPYKSLKDLKGAALGVTKITFLPVLLYRVAAKKAYGFDLVSDTRISEASVSLLPEMLRTGRVDATYSLFSLVFKDIVDKQIREIANLGDTLNGAGWDVALTLYVLSDEWRSKYGEAAARRLADALADLNQRLRTNDAGWKAYANAAQIPAAHFTLFRDTMRRTLIPNYKAQNLASIQEIIDGMVAAAGEPIVGVTTVDPAAFDFGLIG